MTLAFRDLGLGARHVDYEEAWRMQRELHTAVAAGEQEDTVLLLEHPPVYTAGNRTFPEERPADGTPVIDVDRGGKITWHGPGQLVGYPIVRLPDHVRSVDYVRRLEEALLRALRAFGLPAGRIPGRSGAWVADERGERKLAAVGIRVAQRTTMHGFALNVDPDLTWFDRIVPCGITDAGVTSMTAELGRPVSVVEVAAVVRPHLEELLGEFAPFERTPDAAGPRPDPARAPRPGPRVAVVTHTASERGAAS
ncbi:lipoyl(octanoyl) transferase LipB [Propionicicella superfundia]|uniref:lipoyl(octanoyl) transferase LipB n=1 Tax=Propionicicella superfundia TaxID=348582 RepID=UPI00040170C7|nr:lipoyl(octanoyl) transferase LipB [Propionicicella superfundia]